MNGNKAYKERSMTAKIAELSRFFPCVLVTGARQVGKSTLLTHIMPPDMRYVTLDDYKIADYAKVDPIGFLDDMGYPLCIDEIQYAPDLLRAIKMKVDREQKPGMYWFTGSQRFVMMKGISESLAGRIGIADLHSLSQREACGNGLNIEAFNPEMPKLMIEPANICDLSTLYERILRGGYPKLLREAELNLNDYFRSYVQTYVERDVHALTQVSNQSSFVKLMRSAALRTGQQLVYSDLARDAGISPKTATAWVSILQASGIVELLEPYHINTTKRLAKTPKLYFMDTGLCCYLAGWDSAEQLKNSAFAGAILETWVYGQLVRSYTNTGQSPRLTYYRDRNGAEVDFLLEHNDCLYPMEVKRSSSPSTTDLKWVKNIPHGAKKIHPGIVFCTADSLIPMAFGTYGFPISAL